MLTSYLVQFILPLTHVHSTQEPFNQASIFFRNFPLASRHTGSASLTHFTKLYSVQVQFVLGLSSHTSPGCLSLSWLSKQENAMEIKTSESPMPSVSQSVIQSVRQSVDINQTLRPSVGQSVSRSASRLGSHLVCWSVSQLVGQPDKQPVSQSASHLSQSVSQAVSQPVRQSLSQAARRSVSQKVCLIQSFRK